MNTKFITFGFVIFGVLFAFLTASIPDEHNFLKHFFRENPIVLGISCVFVTIIFFIFSIKKEKNIRNHTILKEKRGKEEHYEPPKYGVPQLRDDYESPTSKPKEYTKDMANRDGVSAIIALLVIVFIFCFGIGYAKGNLKYAYLTMSILIIVVLASPFFNADNLDLDRDDSLILKIRKVSFTFSMVCSFVIVFMILYSIFHGHAEDCLTQFVRVERPPGTRILIRPPERTTFGYVFDGAIATFLINLIIHIFMFLLQIFGYWIRK